MNNILCGASRPLAMPEAGVLIVIIVIALALALAGLPTAGVLLLIAETLSLGARLLTDQRRRSTGQARSTEA
ncbi:hypothetical protein AB0L04_30950 [Streptomyces glaucescens]|uniref:hypothetical protein n=1 Tax=Streptomyces glaucescens TaxID=1907 RepID=UPI00345023C7